jgi:hypothetical protein
MRLTLLLLLLLLLLLFLYCRCGSTRCRHLCTIPVTDCCFAGAAEAALDAGNQPLWSFSRLGQQGGSLQHAHTFCQRSTMSAGALDT